MQIYVVKGGQQTGPFSEAQIQSMLQAQTLSPSDSAWHEGLPAWVPLSQLLKSGPNLSKASPGFAPPPTGSDVESIYRPPSATLQAPLTPLGGTYAGFWWRVLGSLIDGVVIQIGFWIVQVVLTTAGFLRPYLAPNREIHWDMLFRFFLVSVVLTWLYRALMESSSFQGTLGKMACGLRVTDLEGRRVGFGRASGRYFGTFISSMTFLIGYLMCIWTEKKQCLHDMMAGCLVLKK